MTRDFTERNPFDVLGLLGGEQLENIERRAEALESMARLGMDANEDAAVAPEEGAPLDGQAVSEAARRLRDPVQWLQETLFWPEGNLDAGALNLVARLLEGGAGHTPEPAALARQLAQEILAAETTGHHATDQPERVITNQLAPPAEPPLYLGPRTTSGHKDGKDGGTNN